MNVRRLRRIKEYILAEPLRVNMDILLRERSTDSLPQHHRNRWPKCGTVACISGWENVLYFKQKKNGYILLDGVQGSIERLELPNNRLFHSSCWPYEFSCVLLKLTPGTVKYAKVVAEAIESYISTNGWQDVPC